MEPTDLLKQEEIIDRLDGSAAKMQILAGTFKKVLASLMCSASKSL